MQKNFVIKAPRLLTGGRWCSGYWLGQRIRDFRVAGSSPGHDTVWLFLRCNHHLGQLSLASLRGR